MEQLIKFGGPFPNYVLSEGVGLSGISTVYGYIHLFNNCCTVSATIFMPNTQVRQNSHFVVSIVIQDSNYRTIHKGVLKIDPKQSYIIGSDQRFLGETSFSIPSAYKSKTLIAKISISYIYNSGVGHVPSTSWSYTEKFTIK